MSYDPSCLFKKTAFAELADYNVQSLIDETTQTYVIDLAQYMPHFEPEFLAMLMDPPTGVYYTNGVEPIISFDHQHYYSHRAMVNKTTQPDIRNFEEFIKSHGPVYSHQGKPVAFVDQNVGRNLLPYPTYNWGAYHIALISVMDYFTRLCKIQEPYTNLPPDWLRIENYVRPKHLQSTVVFYMSSGRLGEGEIPPYEKTDAAFSLESSKVISSILDEIHLFVGKDRHHVYRVKVSGMSIYVEKGIDARVVEYHKLIQSHMESIANDYAQPTRYYQHHPAHYC